MNKLVVALSVFVSAACAGRSGPPAWQSPASDASSVIVGRVKVQDGTLDITHSCKATFTDVYGNTKAEIQLDRSGYVFTQIAAGTTFLEEVRCEMRGISYKTRELDFEVAERDQATYFGHVHFARSQHAVLAEERHDRMMGVAVVSGLLGGVLGGVLTGLVASTTMRDSGSASGPPTSLSVADRPQDLLANYVRAHSQELPLPMTYSIAGPALLMPPTVLLDAGWVTADVDLEGAALTWLGHADPSAAKLLLRLRPAPTAPSLASCDTLLVAFDGERVALGLAPQAGSAQPPAHELVQAEFEAELLRRVLDAKIVQLEACGFRRRLSYQATLAGRRVLEVYLAHLAARSKAGTPTALSASPTTPVPLEAAPRSPDHAAQLPSWTEAPAGP